MKHEEEWKKAKKLCRLSHEDIRMARELGMGPRGLMKNIPNPKQRWKAPVSVWIRDLYEKKFGRKGKPPLPRAPRIATGPSAPPEGFLEPEFNQVEGFVLQPDALSPAKSVTLFERGVSTPGGAVDDSFDIPF